MIFTGRTPSQILITTVLIIIGVWLTMRIADRDADRRLTDMQSALVPVEIHGASPAEVGADLPGRPRTWRNFSIKQVMAEHGQYLKLLKCQIDPEEVNVTFFVQPLGDIQRRRPAADQPPSWWPWDRTLEQSAWRIPDWWQPATSDSGLAVAYTQPFLEGAQGIYLHYDRDSQWLHLWEWKRVGVRLPESPLQYPVINEILQRVSQAMIEQEFPADAHGNLAAQALTPLLLNLPLPRTPSGLQSIAILAYPHQSELRSLIALRGIDRTTAERCLGDYPMRPLSDPTLAPPQQPAWLPPGHDQLPGWFNPGWGPRWQYQLRDVASGELQAQRWAAYDEEHRTLLVWDWAAGVPITKPTAKPSE